VKTVAACILCLITATLAASAIGYRPTMARWGQDGLRSLAATGTICLGAALVAIVPLAVVSIRKPSYIGQAALAATTLRLLLTMIAGGIYQTTAKPDLSSFLFWAVVFYLLLLTVETCFGVLLVRRYYRPPVQTRGRPA